MADNLPTVFDRADGLDGRLGTALPAENVFVQSANGADAMEDTQIEELPDSPEIERGEQATIVKRYRMPYAEACNRLAYLGRGTILPADSNGNVSKVLTAKLQFQAPGFGILTITAEGLSFDVPPDRFNCAPVDLGFDIIKHPRYFFSLQGSNQTENLLNAEVIRWLQNYFELPTVQMRDYIIWLLYFSLGKPGSVNGDGTLAHAAAFVPAGQTTKCDPICGTDMAKRAAIEIVTKYWRGEQVPYIAGYQISWSSFYFRPQYLNPGGYQEDPILQANPQLPAYFFSPVYPPDSAVTMFDLIAQINPQCYAQANGATNRPTISWLRKADYQEEERTWFRVDRTWVGSAIGYWDTELYTAQYRPATPNDYALSSLPFNPKKPTGTNQA